MCEIGNQSHQEFGLVAAAQLFRKTWVCRNRRFSRRSPVPTVSIPYRNWFWEPDTDHGVGAGLSAIPSFLSRLPLAPSSVVRTGGACHRCHVVSATKGLTLRLVRLKLWLRPVRTQRAMRWRRPAWRHRSPSLCRPRLTSPAALPPPTAKVSPDRRTS